MKHIMKVSQPSLGEQEKSVAVNEPRKKRSEELQFEKDRTIKQGTRINN